MKKTTQKSTNSKRNKLFKELREQMEDCTIDAAINIGADKFTGGEIKSNSHIFTADFLAGKDLSQLPVAHYEDKSGVFVVVNTLSTGWLLGCIIDTFYGEEYAYNSKGNTKWQKSRFSKKK